MRIGQWFLKPARVLPDVIHAELVRHVIGGRLPIVVMALTVAMVACFGWPTGARWPALGLGMTALVILGLRYSLVAAAISEHDGGGLSSPAARAFERRYTRLMLPYATVIGTLNLVVVLFGDSAAWMLVAVEIYGFCAGQVSRGSARPRLCGVVVMIAALPTAAAFAVAAVVLAPSREGFALGVVGALVALYAAASLETIAFNYRMILSQLEAKRHLAGLARIDSLTELPNRLSMRQRLDEAFAQVGDRSFALHLLDLDGFKAVNDVHGHPTGDKLLQQVAHRLGRVLRAGDGVYRLGGDEFALIQFGIANPDEVEFLARRVIRSIAEPYMLNDQPVQIGTSVGTALAPADASNIEHLIERADNALYAAKAAGKGTVRGWTQYPPYLVRAA